METLRSKQAEKILQRGFLLLLVKLVESAQSFYIESVDDIRDAIKKDDATNFMFSGSSQIKSPGPFNECLLMYGKTRKNDERNWAYSSSRRAVLFETCSYGEENVLICYVFNYLDHIKMWDIPTIGWGIKFEREDYKKINCFKICVDIPGARDICSAAKIEDQEELAALNAFLMMLECKNIKHESAFPPEKLNKKRIKKGKLPLYEYKILKVELPGKQKNGSPLVGSGVKQRVHLCRGHFKEYTQEKPLFGKYTGRYWWQPNLRGKGDGVIEKEYHIKSKSDV